jgi:hypothetical protein
MHPNTWLKASKCQLPNRPDCVELMFVKAEKSNPSGNCVEVGHVRKASKSAADIGCVEVTTGAAQCEDPNCNAKGINDGDVLVRDSKENGDPNQPVFIYTAQNFDALKREVKKEGMNWPRNADGDYVLTDPAFTGKELHFNATEWDAFIDGINKGEFTYEPNVTTGV